MKTLYLVRHGTVHNPEGIVYRRLPGFMLSDQGIREAEATAGFLAREPLEIIWHSPLERARDTAQAIALGCESDVPLVEDERIHEWDTDEESEAVYRRMRAFLDSWRSSSYGVSAAVSHRDPIRRLLMGLDGEERLPDMDDLSHYPLPQAGVYRVTDSDGVLRIELAFVPPSALEAPAYGTDAANAAATLSEGDAAD